MERFTQRARRVLSLAHEEAERLHHNYIGTEHLLLGLIREEGGVAGRVLRELGLDTARVKEMVERLTGVGRQGGMHVELSPGTEQVLQYAIEEARRMGHHYIGTEHLLLGLVRQGEGVGIEVLRRLGITPEQVRRQTRRVLQESPAQPPQQQKASQAVSASRSKDKEAKTPLVDQLATDLTAL
ncbi:MAG: NDP-hexose 4-ketoreductase, partial [Chloroflexi bacterium]|nr:NDP-hexose 4-ketoreductase [Chloroflexota bacterium]